MKNYNPWEAAYKHPNFAQYSHEDIDEMMICELQEILDQD